MRKHGISETKGDRALTALFYVLLTLFSLLCLYPLALAFSVAFSSEQAVSANGFSIIPQQPTLDTFRYLLSQKMNILIQGYGMTIFITLVGTACSLAITLMYAFAISMPGFRHANKFSFSPISPCCLTAACCPGTSCAPSITTWPTRCGGCFFPMG